MTKLFKDGKQIQMNDEHEYGITKQSNLIQDVIDSYYLDYAFDGELLIKAIQGLKAISPDAKILVFFAKEAMPCLILSNDSPESPCMVVAPLMFEDENK